MPSAPGRAGQGGQARARRHRRDAISDALYTAGMPDPDLLIRTAGEMRVSNFLLWQISYAELWVTDEVLAGLRRGYAAPGAARFRRARTPLRRAEGLIDMLTNAAVDGRAADRPGGRRAGRRSAVRAVVSVPVRLRARPGPGRVPASVCCCSARPRPAVLACVTSAWLGLGACQLAAYICPASRPRAVAVAAGYPDCDWCWPRSCGDGHVPASRASR